MKLTKLSAAPLRGRGAASCPRRSTSNAGTASQLIRSVMPTEPEGCVARHRTHRTAPVVPLLCVLACCGVNELPVPAAQKSVDALFEPPEVLPPPPPPPSCHPVVAAHAADGGRHLGMTLLIDEDEEPDGVCTNVDELWVYVRTSHVVEVNSPDGWVYRTPTRNGGDWTVRWWTRGSSRSRRIEGFAVGCSTEARVLGWTLDFRSGHSTYFDFDPAAYSK